MAGVAQGSAAIPERLMTLRDYVSILWARKWLILATVLAVTAGAIGYSLSLTPSYQSYAEILVEPSFPEQNRLPLEPEMSTEREIASSLKVAELAAEDPSVDSSGAGELLSGLVVSEIPDARILILTYTHGDPEEAQDRADAFARAYLDYREKQEAARLRATLGPIQQRIDALRDELNAVRKDLEVAEAEGDEATMATLQARFEDLSGQIALLRGQLLEPPKNLRPGYVVTSATLPSTPMGPNHARNAALGLLLGLILGVSVTLLREFLDDGLRGRGDLEAAVRAPVLAIVPRISQWRHRQQPLLITETHPGSPASEAYRTLRTGVSFAAAQHRARVVIVTSAGPEEGKSSTAANLAVVLADAGKHVILVSADLRRPRLHHFFDASSQVGLTNVLAGELTVADALLHTGADNLRLLPSGPLPGNPAELLGSEAMRTLLNEVRGASDFVLIDTPPVIVVADPITLAPMTDGILFVADAKRTSRGAAEQARVQLDQVNGRIIGAVLNNFKPNKADRAQHRLGHSYRYSARSEPPPRSMNGRKRSVLGQLSKK